MEAPGGEVGYAHSGWVGDYFSDELGAYKQEEQLATDVLLLGRKTYESFYGAWPQREGSFAEKINTMPKYVASTTLSSLEWDTAMLLRSPVLDAVAELKERETGSILTPGSRTLVHSLLAAGLVDQINLQIFPLILGSGFRLYPDTTSPNPLTLISSKTVANGVLIQKYEVSAAFK